MPNTGMSAWVTKAMIFSIWIADLFLNSKNLWTVTFSGTIPPVFDKREIRIRYSSGCGHRVMIPLHPLELLEFSGSKSFVPGKKVRSYS
jgi:hypothetical protein